MGRDSDHLLAIDAGNTRIKWGVFDGAKWNPCGALPTTEAARLHDVWNSVPANARAFASNVAGTQIQRHIERACAKDGQALTVIGPQPIQLVVTNRYHEHGN